MSNTRKWIGLVAALVVQAVIAGITLAAVGLWAAPWIHIFSVSHASIMAASMCLFLGMGLLGPLGGRLAEAVSIRALMAAGIGLTAGGFVLIARADAMWQVTAVHALLLAPALTLTGPMMGQIVAVRLFGSHSGLAIGVVNLGGSIGAVVMPFAVARMLGVYDWRVCFLILAVLVAALAPFVWHTLRTPPPPKPASAVDGLPGDAQPSARELGWGAILRDRTFVGVALFQLSMAIIFIGVYFNLGAYITEIGGNARQVANVLSLGGVVGVLGSASLGWLAERSDYRWLMLLVVVLIGAAVAVAAMGAGYGQLLVAMPIASMAYGGMLSLTPTILARCFGELNFGRANGLLQFFFALGSLGIFLIAMGRDVIGNYPVTFAIALIALVPALIGVALVRRPPTPAGDEPPDEFALRPEASPQIVIS